MTAYERADLCIIFSDAAVNTIVSTAPVHAHGRELLRRGVAKHVDREARTGFELVTLCKYLHLRRPGDT